MKKYVIKNKLGAVIQVIKTDGQVTAHPAWGKPERVISADSEYDPQDKKEDIIVDGVPHVLLKAEYTIEEKDTCEDELFEMYNRIRSEVLSDQYDIFRVSPGQTGNYLDFETNTQNALNADILRSCRGTKSPYFIKDASFFIDWDLGPTKDKFPDWVKPIVIAYRKYDDDYQTVFSKYAKVNTETNKLIVDDKIIDLWVEFKALWIKYADKLQAKRAKRSNAKDGAPQSY